MTLLPEGPKQGSEAAIWQDVEFGSYVVDLPIWEELARNAGGPVLELGAGSGRVALHLAREGFEVIAVERDPELAEELERRAKDLPVEVIAGDVTAVDRPGADTHGGAIGLVLAPLQLVQLLDTDERRLLLAAIADLLRSGGRCAVTLVDEATLVDEGAPAVKPDMREVGGWVYYSEALWVQVSDEVLRMRRLRERVAPGGDLVRRVHDDVLYRLSPDRFLAEAGAAGLVPVERREVASSDYEAGAILIVLEAR